MCAGGSGRDLPAPRLIAFRARQNDGKSVVQKLPRDTCKPFDGPLLGLPYGSGRQDDECLQSGHAALLQEALHITRRVR